MFWGVLHDLPEIILELAGGLLCSAEIATDAYTNSKQLIDTLQHIRAALQLVSLRGAGNPEDDGASAVGVFRGQPRIHA